MDEQKMNKILASLLVLDIEIDKISKTNLT